MKTNRLFITVVLIITGGFFANISAQEAIKALAKKCESMDNVSVSVVKNRNKETKNVSQIITSISFKNDDALKKEILAAFEKDREMADQEVESRGNGKFNSLFYSFGNTQCSYSEDKNGNVSFSIIEYLSNKKDGAFLENSSFLHLGSTIDSGIYIQM